LGTPGKFYLNSASALTPEMAQNLTFLFPGTVEAPAVKQPSVARKEPVCPPAGTCNGSSAELLAFLIPGYVNLIFYTWISI
jgi:hypothetical protein